MPAGAVGGDEFQHRGLLLRERIGDRRSAGAGRKRGARVAVQFLRLLDPLDRIGVRDVARFAAAERIELFSPIRRDRIRIAQVVLVEFFHEGGISAGKLGRLGKLLEKIDAHAYLPVRGRPRMRYARVYRVRSS